MKQLYRFLMICCSGSLLLLAASVQSFSAEASPASEEKPVASGEKKPVTLEEAQREVQKSVTEMLSITGSVLSGMSSGMQEGAQQIQEQLDGADGTRLVNNKKDLTELLLVSVLRMEDLGNDAWRVTLAIKNENAFPLRLVNLTAKNAILLLDAKGFAHEPKAALGLSRVLTIAGRSAVKLPLEFTELEAKPKLIRLFDADIPVTGETAQSI